MRGSPALDALPAAVRKALAKLGSDISIARRRRRITMAIMAERAFITRQTLGRVERGDPAVSIGIYATVLFVLGMTERITTLADGAADRLGTALEEAQLPTRVRSRKA